MKRILFFILALGACLNVFSQAPLIPSVRCSLSVVNTFSDPYSVTGKTVDFSSNWNATDIVAGDSLYLLDGSQLRVYRVVSIASASGTNFTMTIDDINNSGNIPVTGDYGAFFRGTSNYDFPNWVAGVSEQLNMAIQNRFVQRLDAIIAGAGGAGIDYITTDSFSTFNGGASFASIPLNNTVLRTTTGSIYEKTTSTSMVRRSMDNGLWATTVANTSNDSIQFNANLNNRVQMTTGNVTNAYVLNPLNYQTQTVGETFVIGVQAGTSAVTVNWSSVYGVYTGTSFNTMPTTVVPAQSIMTFTFRVITTSSEVIRFHYVDNISTSSGFSQEVIYTKNSHGFTVGQIFTIASISGVPLLANADVDTLYGMGIVTQVVDANTFKGQSDGTVTLTAHGKTRGLPYYVDDVAGAVTTDTTGLSFPCIAYEVLDANTLVLRFQCMQLQHQINLAASAIPKSTDGFNFLTSEGERSMTVKNLQDKIKLDGYVQSNNANFKRPLQQSTQVLISLGNTAVWDVGKYQNAILNQSNSHTVLITGTPKTNVVYTLTANNNAADCFLSFSGNVLVNGNPATGLGEKTIVSLTSFDGRSLTGDIAAVTISTAQQFLNTYKDSSIVLAIFPTELQNASKERAISEVNLVTQPFKVGDAVGSYVERSNHAWSLNCSNAAKPDIYSDATRISFRFADPVNSSRVQGDGYNYQVDNGKYLTDMSDGIFTWDFIVRSLDDAGQSSLAACGTSAAQHGFSIVKEASTRFIRFRLWDGDGTAACDVTTTNGLFIADGWQAIRIRGNGTTVTIELKGVSTSGAITPFAAPTALVNNPFIGYSQSGDSWEGLMGPILFANKFMATSTLQAFESLNTTSVNLQQREILPGSFTLNSVQSLWADYDFSTTTNKWTDVAKTTPAAIGDDIYVAATNSGANRTYKDIVAVASGQRGTLTANQQNGLPALVMASTDRYVITETTTIGQGCGDYTVFFVGSTDTSAVRTVFGDNVANFVRFSATTNVTNGENVHLGEQHVRASLSTRDKYNNEFVGLTLPLYKGQFNIVALVKKDSTTSLNANGVSTVYATRTNATNLSNHVIHTLGDASFPLVGKVGQFIIVKQALSQTAVDSVMKLLSVKWNIPLVNPTPKLDDGRETLLHVGYESVAKKQYNYISFGMGEVKNDTLYHTTRFHEAHNRNLNSNQSNQVVTITNKNVVVDTMILFKDNIAGKTTAYQPYSSFWDNGVNGVAVTIFAGDCWNSTVGATSTDSIMVFFRTFNRKTKTRGTLTQFVHPSKPLWTDKVVATGIYAQSSTTWYMTTYYPSAGGSYTISVVKTTNAGSSWTEVLNLPGTTWSYTDYLGVARTATNVKPEEPRLTRLNNGKWMLGIRIDDDDAGSAGDNRGFFTLTSTSTSPDSWALSTLRQGFINGFSSPDIYQLSNGTLVAAQRDMLDAALYGQKLKTFIWASDSKGLVWVNLGQIDTERQTLYGFENMYSYIRQFSDGTIWCIVSAADETGEMCNVSRFDITHLFQQ